MAKKLLNRAKMTVSGTPGTGAITLGVAASGWQSFAAAGVSNGDTFSYLIEDGAEREIGTATYSSTGPTITRSVIFSSQANATLTLTSNATVTATALASDVPRAADRQVFTASGTWTKPSGFGPNAMALIEGWGAGGGGASATSAAGGGGGAYTQRWVPLASLGATETVTVGAGGAAGVTAGVGGNSSFGSWLTAYGGGGASSNLPGSGGGLLGPGSSILTNDFNSTFSIVKGGGPVSQPIGLSSYVNPDYAYAATADSHFGGGAYLWAYPSGGKTTLLSGIAGSSVYGGACAASGVATGGGAGNSVYGGGGGGARASATVLAFGTSQFGGNGGAGSTTVASPGVAPGGGGGGGATGGAGARGEVRITVFDGA